MHKDHITEMLNYLQKNPGWHTSNELAMVVGVSKRSIKRYAKNLLESENIYVSNQGYCINQKKNTCESKENNYYSYDSIQRLLINKLTQKDKLNIYDLSEDLYLSETTILKLLKKIQKYVKLFNLELFQSSNNWSLRGNEIDKRRLISDNLYKEYNQTFISTKIIEESFPDINVKEINNSIKKLACEENIYLNEFDFNNILLHVSIATHRIKNGYKSYESNKRRFEFSQKNTMFGSSLINLVEKIENIKFSIEERESLLIIIQLSITRKRDELKGTVSEETELLVDDLIKYVNTMLNIDLRLLNFREQFAIHIQRLLERSSYGYVERNPMVSKIRESSPIIYECAVLISNRLRILKNIDVKDDEIAYIAMHIGNAVSEYISDLHKLYVVILIPDYQSDIDNFISRLERLFNKDIVIGDIIYSPLQLKNSEYLRKIDFVIQVNFEYPLKEFMYTNISQFLTQLDCEKISNLINNLKHKRKKHNFTDNLKIFFPIKNFKIVDEKITKDKLFSIVCSELERDGTVDRSFLKQLRDRELMSSTAFGRVAIPHSLQMSALKTQGYIVIAPKGIVWDSKSNKVNLVFFLAVNSDSKSLYRNIFDDLSQIAVRPENIAKLVCTNTYEEFIQKLTDLL
ncbi:MAG: transcription antiterminator [Lactobacillus sp.]|nr:transcription antiterminator [Lactobacillus sp.]